MSVSVAAPSRVGRARGQNSRPRDRGDRPTESVPSVEEFLGVARDSEKAFKAGFYFELFDVVVKGLQAATRLAGHTELNTSLVTLPRWAVEALRNASMSAILSGEGRRLKRGERVWYRRYRADLIHWHRYVVIVRAIGDGFTQVQAKDGSLTAFDHASEQLTRTSFGASASTMEASYREVRTALDRGESWRFLRSASFILYEQLLDPTWGSEKNPVVIRAV